MVNLTAEIIKNIDNQGMWNLISSFPDQWDDAVESARSMKLKLDPERVSNIVIVGMGASAMGGDLIRAYALNQNSIPVIVNRHYDLPSWVDKHTLLIVSSYSGETEETLSCLEQARKKGAQIIGLASGGPLLERLVKLKLDYIKLPAALSARATLAYNFIPHYFIFQKLGLIRDEGNILEDTSVFLHRQVDKFSDFEENEALSLAIDIQDTLPVIYSDGQLMEPVNLRWRGQMEENAKTLAFGNFFPELTHNEIVGWEQIAHLTGRLSVIILADIEDNPRVKKRMEIIKELISEQVAGLFVLKTQGNNRLTRLLSLVQFADWTSMYLALINNVNPTPTTKIDLLKKKLAEVE